MMWLADRDGLGAEPLLALPDRPGAAVAMRSATTQLQPRAPATPRVPACGLSGPALQQPPRPARTRAQQDLGQPPTRADQHGHAPRCATAHQRSSYTNSPEAPPKPQPPQVRGATAIPPSGCPCAAAVRQTDGGGYCRSGSCVRVRNRDARQAEHSSAARNGKTPTMYRRGRRVTLHPSCQIIGVDRLAKGK